VKTVYIVKVLKVDVNMKDDEDEKIKDSSEKFLKFFKDNLNLESDDDSV
jgi:hypothetical protein